MILRIYGDYCDGVTPFSISNKEVKPISADGTTVTSGRVGRCQIFFKKASFIRGFFFNLFYVNKSKKEFN